MSSSQNGHLSVPAAPFIMEAQSSMGDAANMSSPTAKWEVVCVIVTPIPAASLIDAAAMGANTIATAMSTEIMER